MYISTLHYLPRALDIITGIVGACTGHPQRTLFCCRKTAVPAWKPLMSHNTELALVLSLILPCFREEEVQSSKGFTRRTATFLNKPI